MYNSPCKGVLFMFGTRLKQLREEKQLTQQQLADLLNVGRPTIAGYETKGKEPDFEKIIWLAKYFDVSIDYLLGNTGNRHEANKNSPLANEQGDQTIQRALKDTGLLSADGTLSAEGEDVISAFLKNNAEILKKLIKEND